MEDRRRFEVYFALSAPSHRSQPDNSILVWPKRDKWNDFTFETRAHFSIKQGELEPFHALGFIGFLGELDERRNGIVQLAELVRQHSEPQLLVGPQHNFFTMLPSMDAYREITRALGPEIARDALLALRDVVAASEAKSSSPWLEEASRTAVFTMSFVRESESYFAYKNAGSILRGLELEELGGLSPGFKIEFQLPGYRNAHKLHFRFDHSAELPKRIAVVIGKNGVGKSQTLGRLVKAALDDDPVLTGSSGERPTFSRILAFAPTNEAESVFPSDRRSNPRVWYQRYSLNRSRRSRRSDYVSDLVIQVARSSRTIKEQSRWSIFTSAIQAIAPLDQVALQTRDPVHPYLPLSELERGGEQRRLENFAMVDERREPVRFIEGTGYPLSSGEISFLKFAAQVSLHMENGSLLLLDEPETHLHPNFISRFVSLLQELLERTGSAAIIATHSVYFVREVMREQVTVLRRDQEGFIRYEHPTLRTFGADVGAISYFVFGEDELSRLANEVKERLLSSQLSWNQIYERFSEELSLEFLNEIRADLEPNKSRE